MDNNSEEIFIDEDEILNDILKHDDKVKEILEKTVKANSINTFIINNNELNLNSNIIEEDRRAQNSINKQNIKNLSIYKNTALSSNNTSNSKQRRKNTKSKNGYKIKSCLGNKDNDISEISESSNIDCSDILENLILEQKNTQRRQRKKKKNTSDLELEVIDNEISNKEFDDLDEDNLKEELSKFGIKYSGTRKNNIDLLRIINSFVNKPGKIIS